MLLIPTLLCPKSWENMSGNDSQRFCTHCRQFVHNLDALSVSERLALLSAPAAKLRSRYQIAIRRPARGRRKSYARHLLKYGAAVAITGGTLLVLWETSAQADKSRRYRIYTGAGSGSCPVMPADDYEEVRTHILGEIYVPPARDTTEASEIDPPSAPPHVDLEINPLQIDQLFKASQTSQPMSAPDPIPPHKPQVP